MVKKMSEITPDKQGLPVMYTTIDLHQLHLMRHVRDAIFCILQYKQLNFSISSVLYIPLRGLNPAKFPFIPWKRGFTPEKSLDSHWFAQKQSLKLC
jgi:hypothetical protein